jgi:hypothetical protein
VVVLDNLVGGEGRGKVVVFTEFNAMHANTPLF